MDITKYSVHPFKSYKVCISLDDPGLGSAITPTCTHLFSFETAVPYVDARPSKALLDEGELVKSSNSQKDNAGDGPSASEKVNMESRMQDAKGADESQELEGEAHGQKIWEGRDELNATRGTVVESEGENGKEGSMSAKKWDDGGIEQNRKGKEDEGMKVGGSVKTRGKWEVARVLLEDTRDFVRDSFHGGEVEGALGEREVGDKSGEFDESDESGESGDSGETGETGERGVRENKEKRSNGEILSFLAPLVLVIISLL